MSWRHVSRSELLEYLEGAERSPAGIDNLRRWLREVLVDSDIEIDDAAASLIYSSVERLEVAGANDSSLRELAGELRRLIGAVPDDDLAKELIPLVEERKRVTELLEKVAEGRISRTAFLSYVAERHWPATIKDRVAGMSNGALRDLHRALANRRYEKLPVLLSMS